MGQMVCDGFKVDYERNSLHLHSVYWWLWYNLLKASPKGGGMVLKRFGWPVPG